MNNSLRRSVRPEAIGYAIATLVLLTQAAHAEDFGSFSAGYNQGFYVKDADGNNSLQLNGLLQPRFNHFETSGTAAFGAVDQTSNNFDLFLGRLYFSGTVLDPSITYWFTLQSTTTGNGSSVTLLDAFVGKTFSPYLRVDFGKYWSAYTYEYYDDIGKYLLPDLSAAEWAFSLGRQTGVRVSGRIGRFAYNLSASNSIPGSDVSNTENLNGRVATVLNLQYDLLSPYGYRETDPSPAGARQPELSLWVSGANNPIDYSSGFENDLAGDTTHDATASVNFRYGFFTFQGSGYYKHTDARTGVHAAFNSEGWQEQAGYYLVPGRFEWVERIDRVHWGLGQIAATGGSETQWYSGPDNFSYRQLTEYTTGFNYYFFPTHNVKIQCAYSHLPGEGFDNRKFDANRLIVQAQVAF